MFRKDVNERSPMRVFEKSIHGGLGRGNVGIVAAKAGVGKTPLLVQIALDDLLRDRKVLHLSLEHAVDHVRDYYDELFFDLAEALELDNPDREHLEIERKRLIYSLLSKDSHTDAPTLKHIGDAFEFARTTANFEPEVLILDGLDFHRASLDTVRGLGELAKKHGLELWASATVDDLPVVGKLPVSLERFRDHFDLVLYLDPKRDVVSLRLLKDHDSLAVSEFHLRLDPRSMGIAQAERNLR